MKTIKLFIGLLTTVLLTMIFMTTSFATDADISLSVSIPTGSSTELVLPGTATFGDLKSQIEKVFNISFADDGFGIYCSDARIYYDHAQPEDTKTLNDLGFKSGYKVYAEKEMWTDTTQTPIKLFGLTITGGKGCCEPFGSYSSADYYWNYYHKTITIKTSTPIKISGKGEPGANIIVNNGNKYTNLTVSDLSLTCNDGACIWLNSNSWLKLTSEGENTFVSTGQDAVSSSELTPAISMNSGSSNTYLIINGTSGKLTATTYCEGMPGIGTCSDSATVWGMDINGGTVIANGGPGAPGIRTGALYVSGGDITANGGEGSTEGILVYGSGNALFTNPLEVKSGIIKTSVIKPNQTDSNVGVVVINEGSDIDEIIDSNVYCNVNNDTTITNGTKYYVINNATDSEKASIEFFAGITAYKSKQYAKAGDVVTFALTPADGFEVADVKVNGTSIDSIDGDYEFVMPDEITEISVAFKGDSVENYKWTIEYDGVTHSSLITAEKAGEYTVIFADYENGALNAVNCVTASLNAGENTVFQTNTDITLSQYDKVMIWKDITGLTPVCEALMIK